MEFISHSEKETLQFAAELAKKSRGGTIYALKGELSGGKTAFARGFAAGLGIRERVTSPTFVIQKNYSVPKSEQGIIRLAHFDLYRLSEPEDAALIGLFETVEDEKTVSLIEWPERIALLLSQRPVHTIEFEIIDSSNRKITYDDTLS